MNSYTTKTFHYDLILVGHFALDEIIIKTPYSKSYSLGGGVTYGSLAAAHFDPQARIGIVSRVGKDFDSSYLDIFSTYNIDLSGVKFGGHYTTSYQLYYHDKGRDLKLKQKAPNITLDDFPDKFLRTRALHLTPIADEFSPEFLKTLAQHEEMSHTIFGIDVQGMIRGFSDDGSMFMKKDRETHKKIIDMLSIFGDRMYFKASDKEAQAVTDEEDLYEAAELLSKTGANIFITLGERGLIFKVGRGPIIKLNAYRPNRCVDETGAGDCFMAVLLLQLGMMAPEERKREKILEAAKIASAASSFLIEEPGPKGFRHKEHIIERIHSDREIL